MAVGLNRPARKGSRAFLPVMGVAVWRNPASKGELGVGAGCGGPASAFVRVLHAEGSQGDLVVEKPW